MDFLSKLIDTLDKEKRQLLISAIVLFPFAYTCLYLGLDTFVKLSYFEQTIFSITASIFYVCCTVLGSTLVEETYGKKSSILVLSAVKACFSVIFAIISFTDPLFSYLLLPLLFVIAFFEIIAVSWSKMTNRSSKKHKAKITSDSVNQK